MDWLSCRTNKSLVKEVSLDKNLIESLVKSSSKKEYSQKILTLDENTAGSKVSLAYDSIRELLEALALKKGFKIYNHECYAGFLKEVMNESRLADEFDKLRKIRNSINYYGKDITPTEAEFVLKNVDSFITVLKSVL